MKLAALPSEAQLRELHHQALEAESSAQECVALKVCAMPGTLSAASACCSRHAGFSVMLHPQLWPVACAAL